jgi:hypothetical protein
MLSSRLTLAYPVVRGTIPLDVAELRDNRLRERSSLTPDQLSLTLALASTTDEQSSGAPARSVVAHAGSGVDDRRAVVGCASEISCRP